MDSQQEAKLSMYLKVQQFLTEKLAVLVLLFSIIADYKTALDNFITDILEADAKATADTTGYTEAKQNKRNEVTELALRISGGGAAYYKSIDDSGSQNEIYFTPTEFVAAKDTEVFSKAMQVYRLGNAAGAALAPHGITLGDISSLNLKALQYLAMVELPKRKVSAKAAQGKKVDALMKETDDLLKESIDPQMRVLKGTANNDLLDEYTGNRGIDSNPTGGGSGSNTIVREADVPFAADLNVDISTLEGTVESTITIEISGTALKLFSAITPGGIPGASVYEANVGTVTMLLSDFATATGIDETRPFLTVRNSGAVPGHYKLTFTNMV